MLKVTQYENKKLNETLSDGEEIMLLPCKDSNKTHQWQHHDVQNKNNNISFHYNSEYS